MKKIYKVKIIFIDGKEKIEIVSAKNELEAIDMVMKQYNSADVLDIKII